MTLSAAWTWRCRSWKISSSRPDSLALGHSVRVINTAAFCIIKRRLRDQNHTVHIFYNCLPLLETTAGQKRMRAWRVFFCACGQHAPKNLQECARHHSPPVTLPQRDASTVCINSIYTKEKTLTRVFPQTPFMLAPLQMRLFKTRLAPDIRRRWAGARFVRAFLSQLPLQNTRQLVGRRWEIKAEVTGSPTLFDWHVVLSKECSSRQRGTDVPAGFVGCCL